jgi:thiamine-monophosphate kinase
VHDGADRPLTEGEIISIIREMVPLHRPGVRVPTGDDAAQFHFAGGDVLLTTDSIFEGVHFDLGNYGFADVGWKAMAAGVSDIAAMGGQPACALVSVGFGEAPTTAQVRSLVSGTLEMLDWCNCALVGGDVCRSTAGLSLTVTVAGTPPQGGAVLRSGARKGDAIGVTGTVGDSRAGLFILKSGREELRARYPGLVEAHLRPKPALLAGGIIASAGASSLEDVSDGLGMDLWHICVESRVGCLIEERRVPISDDAAALAQEVGSDRALWALAGGEDYQLVFTAAPDRFDKASRLLGEHGIMASRIGTVRSGDDGCVLVRADGSRVDLGGLGFDHFAGA